MLEQNNLSSSLQSISLNQTPIKRGKLINLQPQTAESQQPITNSLQDIDPKDLFQKFNQLVKVTQDQENICDDFQVQVVRKLDYENIHTIKLDFQSKQSSMKKKSKIHQNIQKSNFKAMNLFQIPSKTEEEKQNLKEMINFDIYCTPIAKQKKQRHDLSRAAHKQIQQE